MLNKLLKLSLMAMALTAVSCSNSSDSPHIGRQYPEIKDNRMSPEVLWAMGRVGGVQVSPDGKRVLYSVSYYSVEQDKSNSDLFMMNADGTGKYQLTDTEFRETAAKWFKGGEKIAYLSSKSGSMQLWIMDADGSDKERVTDVEGGISDFAFSPDETKLLYVADVKYGQRTVDLHPDLPKSSGLVVEDLMYKHWDEWVTTVPHPFVADFDGSALTNITDILEGEPYESPMKPFGGIEQLAWSPDGKTIAYTSRKKEGMAYAVSTNSDIYFYDLKTGKTENKTEGMMGYDQNPAFSPDGKWLMWQSMERDGYESDRNRLCVYNLNNGQKTFVTESFESGVDDYCWNNDSQSLYFIGVWHGTSMVYSTNLNGDIKKLTDGMYDYGSVAMAGDKIITKRQSISAADEIYTLTPADGQVAQLSHENDHIFKQLKLGKVEERWTKTTDGKQMLSWVIYPTNFDANKKYPTLLFCEGGPQSPVSQFWSYRWNFQIMAANDYIIIAPNRRGLPGFGMEWLEQISGDYGGQCMKDYLSAIDDISKEPYVDTNRLGCVGASFGGFSVYWLAGHHDKRFKAFIAHDGIFNMEQQYLETEEMWFANWDMGGAYWDKNNATAQRTFANSPHRFVDKWDTPILCIHGEKDYRILASQGMSAFNAAVLRGVPAELLLYPDENHWVLKPQNGVLWQRTFFSWLDKWLK